MKYASTRLLLGLAVGFSMLACLTSASAHDYTFSVVYTFLGGSDGAGPIGTLLLRGGNIFGLTGNGGPCVEVPQGCGTAFELTPTGTKTVLFSFAARASGLFPSSGFVEGAGGALYGETNYGGSQGNPGICGNLHCGTVFKLHQKGSERALYSFKGNADGYSPAGGLVKDSEGNLYGTMFYGGGAGCLGDLGCGEIFKITPNGTKTAFYAFKGGSDGVSPAAGLIQDSAGNMYGTTNFGGGGNICDVQPPVGCGTVFKLTPDGAETVLYAFSGGVDGGLPQGRVAMDDAGNLYGTTTGGGTYGYGTVFELSPLGVETVLYSFPTGQHLFPRSVIFLRKSFTLVGTTESGGGSSGCGLGCGIVFSIAPGHRAKILHVFTNGADGALPSDGLIQDGKGNIYGAAAVGGNGYGTIFKLTP